MRRLLRGDEDDEGEDDEDEDDDGGSDEESSGWDWVNMHDRLLAGLGRVEGECVMQSSAKRGTMMDVMCR